MSLTKNNISLLPLLSEVITGTIKEQVEIPADTLHKMNNNVHPDYWQKYDEITYCNFLEYWKNYYDEKYSENHGSSYAKPVKDAFEKHKTSKITLKLMNTFAWIENRGREKGDNGQGCWGLFQYCDDYWSDYGITSQSDAENADIATRQFVKHATIIGGKMSNMSGKDVFKAENQWLLYLGWQQGVAGTTKIYNGCEDVETFKGDKKLDTTPDVIGPTTAEDIMLGKAILKKGDQSDLVKFIQIMLLKDFKIDLGEGGEFGDGVDGTFLDDTHNAVEDFQEMFGLAVDGVIGKCTLETIIKGKTPKCCKSGACKEDRCKDSSWCSEIKTKKEKIIKKKIKSDKNKKSEEDTDKCGVKYDIGAVSEITPKAPCKDLQLARIPNSSNAWRSGQPTAEELVWIIQTYDIKHIVRMNGDSSSDMSARCGGCLTTKNEEKIAEYFNVEWYGDTKHHSGGSFYSSHGKGKAGEGRNIPGGSVPKVIELIQQGNVLVHCRNGADRTGQMVGGYLSSIDWGTPEQIWNYSIPFNHWGGSSGSVCKPGGNWGYIKYMEVFLPLRDWCEGEEWRKTCPSCDPDYIEKYENSW